MNGTRKQLPISLRRGRMVNFTVKNDGARSAGALKLSGCVELKREADFRRSRTGLEDVPYSKNARHCYYP
jgi:hypothetical protein